jgi:hypothetical protein
MDNETQGQATPPATGTPKKKPGIFGKLAALWKSGVKGKAVCIVGALVILGIIGSCGDDEEGGGGGGNGGGHEWKYTGEYFDSVFKGFPKDEGVIYQHLPHAVGMFGMELTDDYLPPIKVMQATKKGNLVELDDSNWLTGDRFERVIWVETKRRYEDDERLDKGYYIRRGSMEYQTALGSEKTVPRYVEVTDKKMLKKIEKTKQKLQAEEEAKEAQRKAEQEARDAQRKAEEEAREAQRRAEEEAKKKAREEAAEQGAYELGIPVKSLCGFKLGVPPSQVRPLLQNDDGTPVLDFVDKVLAGQQRWGGGEAGYEVTYRLAKPFRLFTHATVSFNDRGVGLHLDKVTLTADIANVSKESWMKEMTTLVELMEKKFGITFSKAEPYSGCDGFKWGSWGDGEIKIFVNKYEECNSLYLEFDAHLKISDMDELAEKVRAEAGKKTIELDATAGADEL